MKENKEGGIEVNIDGLVTLIVHRACQIIVIMGLVAHYTSRLLGHSVPLTVCFSFSLFAVFITYFIKTVIITFKS